jgi:hypothetical protein
MFDRHDVTNLDTCAASDNELQLDWFVPVLNLAPRHEGVLVEWSYSSTYSLTSVLDGDEWSASLPGRFIPRVKSPLYPLDRRLGGPQSRSGRGGEGKNSQPCRESNTDHPIVQPAASRYTD